MQVHFISFFHNRNNREKHGIIRSFTKVKVRKKKKHKVNGKSKINVILLV